MRREWLDVNYYAVLGVAPTASRGEIAHAFHRLARKTHPDANPGTPDAEERFKQIAAAYEVLDDPMTRAAYDRARGLGAQHSAAGPRPQSAPPWTGPVEYDPDNDELWEPWPPPTPRAVTVVVPRARWRWVRPRWMPSPVAFAVVGALSIGVSLVVAWQQQRVPNGWIETTAIVVATADYTRPSLNDPNANFRTIEFRNHRGQAVTRTFEGGFELGEPVSIAYDPNSTRYRVLDANWQAVVLFAACGVGTVLLGLLVAAFTVPGRPFPLGRTRLRTW